MRIPLLISLRANSNRALLSSEDGRIILHDGRAAPSARPRAQDRIQLAAEVTGVQFHPVMDHIFATSEGSGRVCLRDLRMAFGPLTHRTREGIVQTVRPVAPVFRLALIKMHAVQHQAVVPGGRAFKQSRDEQHCV